MSWSATSRYDIASADGGLGLVQDLMNTIAAGRPRFPDLLGDLPSARAWLASALDDWAEVTGRPAPAVDLDERGLEALVALRADLRGVAASGAQPLAYPAGGDLRAVGVGLVLDSAGTVSLQPRGQGERLVVGQLLVEVLEAQRADRWRRLKTCRNERCAVAFYDRSRNNSGAWHDVRVCGNPANLRASRARRRAGTTSTGPAATGPTST